VAEEGPAVVFGELAGESVEASLDLANATNGTYVYNWSRPADGPVQIDYAVSLTSGNESVRVVDGANATLLESVVPTGDLNDTVVIEQAGGGTWTITVLLTDATGSLRMAIQPYEAPPSPDASADTDGNATVHNGTALGNQTADDGAFGIPGFELAALVAAGAVAVALAARRRR
jgi:hypothetical protein